MSQENVEAFTRGIEAINRRDWDALLDGLDPGVMWHPAPETPFGAAVYRGHEDVRQWFEELHEVFPEVQSEFPEIRDLGDRIVAIGRIRTRGYVSGAATESPVAYIIDYENEGDTSLELHGSPAGARSRGAVRVGDVARELGQVLAPPALRLLPADRRLPWQAATVGTPLAEDLPRLVPVNHGLPAP